MNLWLKDPGTIPAEGWHYPVEATGYDVKAPNYALLYDKVKQHCAANEITPPTKDEVDLWLCQNVTTPCFEGKQKFANHYTQREAGKWPLFLMPLRLLAQPSDKGLGDLVGRVIGPMGGTAFEEWYLKTFGRPCGCGDRRANLNARFPL